MWQVLGFESPCLMPYGFWESVSHALPIAASVESLSTPVWKDLGVFRVHVSCHRYYSGHSVSVHAGITGFRCFESPCLMPYIIQQVWQVLNVLRTRGSCHIYHSKHNVSVQAGKTAFVCGGSLGLPQWGNNYYCGRDENENHSWEDWLA